MHGLHLATNIRRLESNSGIPLGRCKYKRLGAKGILSRTLSEEPSPPITRTLYGPVQLREKFALRAESSVYFLAPCRTIAAVFIVQPTPSITTKGGSQSRIQLFEPEESDGLKFANKVSFVTE